MTELAFPNYPINLGDRVFKPEGYRFNGIVVGIVRKLNGQTRYVVENTDGILHIFRESQLQKAEGPKAT